MKTRHGVAVAIAAALVATVSMAGCDDESDDPPDSGLPSRSELSEQTPTSMTTPIEPAQPKFPEEATNPGPAGAKAFVGYYMQLVNYAKDTGDAEALRPYGHRQCGGCNYFISYYHSWYERGGWFKGGDQTIRTFDRLVPAAEPHDIYLRITVDVAPGTYRKRAGAKVERGQGHSSRLEFWLVRRPDGWLVSRLDTPA